MQLLCWNPSFWANYTWQQPLEVTNRFLMFANSVVGYSAWAAVCWLSGCYLPYVVKVETKTLWYEVKKVFKVITISRDASCRLQCRARRKQSPWKCNTTKWSILSSSAAARQLLPVWMSQTISSKQFNQRSS